MSIADALTHAFSYPVLVGMLASESEPTTDCLDDAYMAHDLDALTEELKSIGLDTLADTVTLWGFGQDPIEVTL